MKTSKRILCTLMLVVFTLVNLVVMPASAATFTDVTEGTSVYKAVDVLNKLGVINGYDDGTFKPDNNVTRDEAAKILVCALGRDIQAVDGGYTDENRNYRRNADGSR